MPDWHQYNSTQPIGSEVPSNGQNVNHSPIFGPTISPRRLNGPTYSPEGLNKPQNEASYNPRSFQQSPNTLNGPNVPPENSPMGSSTQMAGSHVHYGTPSPRNSMIEGANPSLDSRTVPGSLSEAINQRNHQISMSRPAGQLNCPTINGSMGHMAQRNTPTNIQPSIPTSSRQGPGTYVACKGPCCNPDTTISYQSWEKFAPYSSNVTYRDTGYPVDNRRFGNEFENREQLGAGGVYAVDPRRNFSDYKYSKDPIVPRPYPHPSGVIQNYPVQNYNFPADYQKYPAYPVKEYPRENPIGNTQNPAVLKYQEQSVIVQQKYFNKPVQYQNGPIPKNIAPTSMGGNVISRTNPYFNPQLARDFPRAYSESTAIPNRGIRSTNPIHSSYPKYQMYQQKIAMQRYTMESQLRDLSRIPGYHSHPKYQDSMLRYKELLRLQQTVDYQSTVQDAPKALTTQGGEVIPPINLQFDQNGVLINANFQPAGYSTNLQSPINVHNSKNVQSVNNAEVGPLNLQQPERFRVQAAFDDRRQDHVQNQVPISLPQPEVSREIEQRYPVGNHQPQTQKYESETLNLSNSNNDSKTPSVDKRNSKDFADKPELDVRQFLANWDESEDEDGANANLPDVVLSNSTSGAVTEHEDTTAVLDKNEEAKNCSKSEDCRGRDDCGVFENIQNETKPYNSSDNRNYRSDLPPSVESTNSGELDLSTSNSERQPVRTGTVIQSTSTECTNEKPFHKLENFTNSQATNLSCRVTKSINNSESQEPPAEVEADVTVKKEESPVKEETLTSIKEHIKAYEHEAKTEIRSSAEDIIENGEDSRSCCGKESSEDSKHHFDSEDDLSESSDSDSGSSDSMSSFIKSPKTIHGTEIHVDAQELSANPGSPKSDAKMVESPNLQKQSSFASEESHNPDDLSLPDLPTSECTPISTTLNTPIHSDSEESTDPIIDLTTPANPIEIIQNSPMLSFTHSPIKMEPYEHLDENDSTDKTSHFEFQTSNSCDNDYGRLTDVSSHTTEQFNIAQNDEDTFDSDCVQILSEKAEQQRNEREMERKNDVTNDIAGGKPFAFNNENVMATDMRNNATVDADRKPWPSVSATEHETKLSNSSEHEDVNTIKEKSEIPSEMATRLSIRSEATEEDNSNDHMAHISNTKNYHSTRRWLAKCESTENLTALNLVKDENKICDKSENLQIVPDESRYRTNSTDDEECRSKIENQEGTTPTENTDKYASSLEEDSVYSETEEDQSNFPGTSNIPLIPGEDFEEPKMPVLPMEGNCLTKILKNTSPITDLDVLGSDDEKLDKMDAIWMEFGGVDTVGKATGANTDAHTECSEVFNREKSLRNKLRMSHKTDSKRVKHLAEAKDASDSNGRGWNEGKGKKSRNETNWQEYKSNTAHKDANPIDRDFQRALVSGTDEIAAITRDNHSFSKATIFSKTACREDGNPSNDICSETTATEIMKCKEKANHINDIATKLLENARLCEPELEKADTRIKESSPGEDNRDSSKERIKLLKEFRKVKNKVKIDKPEDESLKSEGSVENEAAVLVEITDRCEKTNVITTNEKESDSILQVPDTLPIESMSPLKKNVNKEEYTSDLVSADVMMSEEKFPQTSNGGEETIESKNTARKNDDNVNMEGSITAENNSCVNSHQIINTKAVIPIEGNDINECAINLSESSIDFGLLNTLGPKGCVINDSHDSFVSENDETKAPANTKSEINGETICAETKDQTASPPRSPSAEDNASRSEAEEADDTSLETKQVDVENVTESNCESNSSPKSTNFADEYVLKEDEKQGTDQEASENTDHVANEESSSNLEKVEDPPKSSGNPEVNTDSIYENYNESLNIFETNDARINTSVFEQSEDLNSPDSPAVDIPDARKSADETKDPQVLYDAEDFQNDLVDEPTVIEQESNRLTDSLDEDERKSFFNPPSNEEMELQSLENPLQSESTAELVDNCSEDTSVLETEKNTSGSLLVDSKITDCSTEIKKTSEDSEVTLDIHEEPITLRKDSESIEISSILNDFSIESQSRGSRETESLNIASEPVPGTEGGTSTANASKAAFELEDSFNCDFNNFDVAPNINESTNTDESNSWKYSKAYARFEDCERYKNPDNFVDPILTSLESLDNLNTVPVYTTKDGKITYSPNPKFTYRALIMEAREREGYPSMRESYYGNPRTQESSHSSKNQASIRKRKSSEGRSYSSGSYSKKNWTENYKPREHGESSMKNSPESWSRNCFSHDKYSRQSRDRSSHNFIPHNGDGDKKYSAEKIAQERVSRNYKQRGEGHAVFDERDKKKNGTSDHLKSNNRSQFRQSKEQSTSDSVWSGSKRDLKGDQKTSTITEPRSETGKTNDVKKIKTSRSSGSTEKRLNDENQGQDLIDKTEKSLPVHDETKHVNQFTLDIPLPTSLSSDEQLAEKKSSDLEVEEIKQVSLTSDDQPSIEPNLIEISHNGANVGESVVKLRSFPSEWEDSCENSFVQQENILELKESTKSLLNEIEENKLYDEVDDIREDRTSVLHKTDATELSEIPPTNSGEDTIVNEHIEDTDCVREECNIAEVESILNSRVQKDETPEPIEIDERINEQKIPERPKTPNEDEEIRSIRDEEKPAETVPCTDNQIIEDPTQEDVQINKESEIENSIHIAEGAVESVPRELNDHVLRSSEESISLEETAKTERREPKLKSHKIKSESKNGTSVKNVQPSANDGQSLKTANEYENASKPQSQLENYISYSPSNESADDGRVIPKLVIKKTDSLNCKNVGLGSPTTVSHDLFAERVLDKDDQGSKSTAHPKIPKILIRNAKSRPTTPSIEEITEETSFSLTTKEESKVPKVKIRFEDKRSRSPPSNENNLKTESAESKIPKMKIKLEDRQPKVFIENVNKESCRSNDAVQKTIPKMKIKKCKGALRHVADTQMLPVSIPRMFIYTELECEKETSLQTLNKKENNSTDKNVAPNSSQDEEKTADPDVKKIPKLKIKRQSSGCSIELNRKRHSVSPVQSELKKVKKSLKASKTNDKKQSSKTSSGSEHQESPKTVDTFSFKESYEVARFEDVAATDQQQTSESSKHEETTSKRESTSDTPEEIPKVIIKRASPSAEFKCELSKGKRDAIIKNKRWQPEVKLQRSWVLDCMAKDLNLEKLTLKLATPGSILRKCSTDKKPELGKSHVKNTNGNEKKLFRSKSASELISAQKGTEILATNNVAEGRFVTRKRCKSDLESRFSRYSLNLESEKEMRNDNNSTLDSKMEEETIKDSITNSTLLNRSGSYNDGVKFMETSARSPLDENMNSKKEIPAPTIDLDALISVRPLLDSDQTERLKSECECFGYGKEFTDIFMSDSEHRCTLNASKDSATTQNGNVETGVGQKYREEITSNEDNRTSGANYTEENKTAELAAILMGSHDRSGSVIVDTANSMEPDILENRPELSCLDAAKVVDYLETINCDSNTRELDINDNSDSGVRELKTNNAVLDKLESYIDAAEEENTPTLNDHVLIDEHSEPNIGINSITRMEYSKESQSIIEMLSDSPNQEVEIQSSPTLIEENGVCLYHEDAIPTQFELELEVMDHAESDLEVPIPQDDCPMEELPRYYADGTNEPLNGSRTLPEEVEVIRRSKETEKRKTTIDLHVKTTNIKKALNCSDLLVKEVLAAKETLRKCLARSKSGSRFKSKARPKTAAEKKQGSSFDFSRLTAAAVSEDNFNKLEDRLSINITADANSSRQFDEKSSGDKLCQNHIETEYKVNKIKSDRKHSKGGKSSLIIKKKYSSLPKSVDKCITNLTEIDEYLIPKNILIDTNKESVECMKVGETSVSIKNSKLFIKNSSYSETKKKIPELTNSKDSKSRINNKSSRHDVGKSKSVAQNNAPQESSQSNEKSVSDAAKQKYKSSKTSSDQKVNLTVDKTKFKSYKIPKIGKPNNEEPQELYIREARMPILEPQIHLNTCVEASELSPDREISRSPPLITNQSLKHHISSNEDLANQSTTFLDAPEAAPSNAEEVKTVAEIVNNMAYHEKVSVQVTVWLKNECRLICC